MLLASVACAACAQVCDEAPPLPPPHPEHDLVIENDVIRYNGKRLEPGSRMKEWIAVLGPPDRAKESWVVWDSIGIAVSTEELVERWADLGEVPSSCLHVFFETSRDNDPKSAYTGRLLLDGAAFYTGVKLQYIHQQTHLRCVTGPHGFYEGGLPNTRFCRTDRWTYSVGIYTAEQAYWVKHLQVCAK